MDDRSATGADAVLRIAPAQVGRADAPPVAARAPALATVAVTGAVFGGAISWLSAWAATGRPAGDGTLGVAAACGVVGAASALVAARRAARRVPAVASVASVAVAPVPAVTAAEPPQVPQPVGAPLAPVLRSFANLLDAVPHVVWRADRSGVILHVNQTWLREFRRLRPLRVEDLIELLADDDAGAFIGAWDAAQQDGGDVRLRCRLHKPADAEQRWTDLDIRAVQSDNGAPDGWVGTFTDVQDALVKIESAQQALSDERRLRERAERLAAMKDEFLHTVAHELRSPLNAISGWTEILARERDLAASAVHAIGIVRRNARAQAKLISDLQQLSSMVTGNVAMQPAPMDLGVLARESVGRHVATAVAKSVDLVCNDVDPAPVHADASRVGLAIGNLLANAIQFTPPGGRVEVAVRTDHYSAFLTVSDTGCGIAADRLPTLFDCLQPLEADPAHGRPSRRDGLGLGLAVARGMVELNDGILQASSGGPGAGSEFTLTLPLAEPLAARSAADLPDLDIGPDAVDTDGRRQGASDIDERGAIDAVAGLAVLVIEQDADARDLLRVALASLGAQPSAAADVDAGIDLLLTRNPDVLLCDSSLPADSLRLLAAAVDAMQRERRSTPPEAVERAAEPTPAVVATDAADMGGEGGPLDRIGNVLPCGARLRKPVSLRGLAVAVALARSGGPRLSPTAS